MIKGKHLLFILLCHIMQSDQPEGIYLRALPWMTIPACFTWLLNLLARVTAFISLLLMWQKFKTYFVAHLIGLIMILGGWTLSIVNVGLDRGVYGIMPNGVAQKTLFTTPTILGLVLVILGAYFPEIWISIKNRKAKV
jgi:hypothetical protein